MSITLGEFLFQMGKNPTFLIIVLLTIAVIFVNGWTDAPNAIATGIATRALTVKKAIWMAAACNFLGVFCMTMVNSKVAETIYHIVDFRGDTKSAYIALAAALAGIVIWGVLAWMFGIPTSESHALIAGLSGAAIALHRNLDAINGKEWVKVIYGLLLSSILGFVLGFVIVKMIERRCKEMNREKLVSFFKHSQVFGSAIMAFMHGAQDGQKFMGVFLLGVFLAKGVEPDTQFVIPIWLMILCSLVMFTGTSIGGTKIIKTVGMSMVKLTGYQGLSADIAAAISLLTASVFGIPVSTTHTKTTAIIGVGAANNIKSVNWVIVKEMVYAWCFTFPGCGVIGYLIAYFFLYSGA